MSNRPGMASHLFFATLSSGGSQVIGFTAFVVLARVLGTQAFGLVSVAAFLIDMLQLVGAAGLGDALVQRRELRDGEADTAFWANCALGLVLFATTYLGADAIAAAYRQPAMVDILHALSLLFLIVPLGAVHTALLTRELRFKSLAARTLAASLAGAAVGIPMALMHFGVWALVGQRLVMAGVLVVASWHALRWRPRLHFDPPAFRSMVSFGGFVTLSNLILQVNARIAELLCGFFVGPAAVSLIRAGSRLMEIVNQLTFAPLQQISMPVQSRAQDDREARIANYLTMSRLSSALMFPAFFGCLAIATPLVSVVFGPQWRDAATAIQILALGVVPQQLNVLTIGNVNAAGASRLVFVWAVAQATAGFTAVWLAWPWGWQAMLLANLVRSYLLLPLGLWMLRHTIGIRVRAIFASIAPALVAAVTMAAALLAMQRTCSGLIPPPGLLVALLPLGALIYIAVMAFISPAEMRLLLSSIRQRANRTKVDGAR